MELLGTLPVTSNPDEVYNIVILDTVYSIRQLYNTRGFWTLSISDEDLNPIITGVKVVAGIFMLNQYPQIRFNLYIRDEVEPTRDNFDTLIIEVYSK